LIEVHCNVITKQISGSERLKDVYRGANKSYNQYYNPMYCKSLRKYTDDEMKAMTERAIHNLKDHFDFVGTAENSEEDYKKLCLYYGWRYRKPAHFDKVSKRGYKKETLRDVLKISDPRIKELLIEINKYDIEVYNSII